MFNTIEFTETANGGSLDIDSIPLLDSDDFREAIIETIANGARLTALFGMLTANRQAVDLFAVVADDNRSRLGVARNRISGDSFPSLTPLCPQAHLFEREIAEQFGLRPEGHPCFKPVRFRRSWVKGRDAWSRGDGDITPGDMDFYRIEGDEIHEVAVGPVHAGVIEPGHFRFQCHGEDVFHLEISLGYQHRGIEEALIGGPTLRSPHLLETAAGDTTIGHMTAYCQNIETLGKRQTSARAQAIGGISLELERLANHVGDIGALANDVGFLPTASFCGRLRGDYLNMTALLCGNRFGRGMIVPGGVGFDIDESRAQKLIKHLEKVEHDTASAINLLWDASSAMARFENTGTLSSDDCRTLGIVGPAARASGLALDARQTQPWGIYRFSQIPAATWQGGDVFARGYVRWLEIQRSIVFIRDHILSLPAGEIRAEPLPLEKNRLAVSLIEGWRGEICHTAITDGEGRFARYKIVDPSFRNWTGLARALRNQDISDFPLCNKSFNLSYCGFDL